ncbi:MAG: nitroreductase family protein [Candidatus Omnitrophota bacterium]
MELLDILRSRRSIRVFQPKAIPPQEEKKLMEALRWAPSAGNLQCRRFYFVRNEAMRKSLAEAARGQSFVAEAPLLVVACADERIEEDYGSRGKTLYGPMDVAASVQNLLLEAHVLGLGGVWVGAFDEKKVSEVLQLPRFLRPVTMVPLGYPAEKPEAPSRLSAEKLVCQVT